MDITEFDVILGMEWLTAHRVIIDVIVRGLSPTHQVVVALYFKGISITLDRVRF